LCSILPAHMLPIFDVDVRDRNANEEGEAAKEGRTGSCLCQ
jgi:hypothetical protein